MLLHRLLVLLLLPIFLVLSSRVGRTQAFNAEEFWREQSDVPLNVTVLNRTTEDDVTWQAMVYTSEMYRNEPMRVFAYYAHPTAPGKYPGIVFIHGGGGGADLNRVYAYAQAGYACLAFDWNTYGDPLANWKRGDPLPTKPYTVFGNLRYDEWKRTANKVQQEEWGRQFFQPKPDWKGPVLYRAVMAARRGLSWLSQRTEVDANKLAVEGHSWGGFMAQLLTGIDPRVKTTVSAAAAGAWERRYKQGIAMHLQELSATDMQEWAKRYDPGLYAERMTAPILIRLGASDFFGSVDTLADYWPQIKAQKSLQLLSGGNHFFGIDVATPIAWFNHRLKAGAAFPAMPEVTVTPAEKDSWTVRVQAKSATPITKASFAWTTASGTWDSRFWAQRALSKDGESWSATFTAVQAGGDLRVFASVLDTNGRVVSSLPVVLPLPAQPVKPPVSLNAITVPIVRTAVSPLEKPDAWAKAPALGPLANGPEVIGEQSAHLRTLWDAQALYVNLEVDDRTPWVAALPNLPLWTGDSVQLRLNTNPPIPGVQPDEQKIVHLSWYPDAATGALRLDAERGADILQKILDVTSITGKVAVKKDAGYTLTLRIPWNIIDPTFKPAVNSQMHFAFQINMGDLLTTEWIGGINFNSGLEFYNPDGWGLGTLLDEKQP